jgi:Prefoldin subunit
MAIPNAALQKVGSQPIHFYNLSKMLCNQLLQEVESQAIQSQQQINIVKSQINVKQRDARLNQLTFTELSQLSRDTKVYEGLGKMSVTATSWCDQPLDHR